MSSKKDRKPKPSRKKLLEKLGRLRFSTDVTMEAAQDFFQALDCPRSLTASLLLKYKEFDQLVSLEANPQHYANGEAFRDSYLASSFLSRNTFLRTSFNKKELALAKFESFENVCRQTNRRFRNLHSLQSTASFEEVTLLYAMKSKIVRILGPFSPDELLEQSSWGPGTTTLIKGDNTSAAKKFQCETGITRDLYPLAFDLLPKAYPGWSTILKRESATLQEGNMIITVPKTSKIDRVIAIEPGINLWFQLGLGRMIKRRMVRFGIDLTSQTRNQQLARSSSISGELATVDFSSASDSIALELVRELFDQPVREGQQDPVVWFEVMDCLRSKYGCIGSKTFRWEKFSSMGNGFTWDLESLIFYSAALVVCEHLKLPTHEVSVFGDDVILPSKAYALFASFSKFLGFSVNSEKSFSTRCFRESCGSHYYSGVDCKPIYLKDRLTSPQQVYNLTNTLRIRSHMFYGCEVRFRDVFYKWQRILPKQIRFKVPAVYNPQSRELEPTEGGFLANFDEACPNRAKYGVEGFRFRRFAWVAVKLEVEDPGLLLASLHGLERKLPSQTQGLERAHGVADRLVDKISPQGGNRVPLRDRTKCRLVTTFVRRWYDLGPWI